MATETETETPGGDNNPRPVRIMDKDGRQVCLNGSWLVLK